MRRNDNGPTAMPKCIPKQNKSTVSAMNPNEDTPLLTPKGGAETHHPLTVSGIEIYNGGDAVDNNTNDE